MAYSARYRLKRKLYLSILSIILITVLMSAFLTLNAENEKKLLNWEREPSLIYEDIEYFEKNISIFTQNGKKGLISIDGTIKAEAKYDTLVKCVNCNLLKYSEDDSKGIVLDEDYNVVGEDYCGHGYTTSECYYDTESKRVFMVNSSEDSVNVVECMGTEGPVIMRAAKFGYEEMFDEQIFLPVEKLDLYGIYSRSGKVVEPQYDNVSPYENGFAAVEKNGKWAYIDEEGKLITDFIYNSCKGKTHETYSYEQVMYPASEGYIAVCKDGKWGYIDTEGKQITDFVFEKTQPVYQGKAWVKVDGKWGVADMENMPVTVKSVNILGYTGSDDLVAGMSFTLEYEVSPKEASKDSVIFESGDESIATVDENFLVKCLKAGTSTITAKNLNGDIVGTYKLVVFSDKSGSGTDGENDRKEPSAPNNDKDKPDETKNNMDENMFTIMVSSVIALAAVIIAGAVILIIYLVKKNKKKQPPQKDDDFTDEEKTENNESFSEAPVDIETLMTGKTDSVGTEKNQESDDNGETEDNTNDMN